MHAYDNNLIYVCTVSHPTGDVMSVKNLHNLLVVPSGCGEQSMSRTAINHIVAAYLDSTEQLTDAITARITGNLKLGG